MKKTKTPLVSIIIPTYNRTYALSDLLLALTRQSCQDFEVVIYNDCGVSVQGVVDRYPELTTTLLNGTKNSGGTHARNKATQAARGSFIMTMDDDDLLVPGHLQNLLSLTPEADLVYADAEVVMVESQTGQRSVRSRHTFAYEFGPHILARWLTIVPSGMVYRRALHDALGFFDENFPNAYWDWDWILRVSKSHLIKNTPLATVLYLMDETGTNMSTDHRWMSPDLIRLAEKHGLKDLYTANFRTLIDDVELKPFQRQTKIIWDGIIEHGR